MAYDLRKLHGDCAQVQHDIAGFGSGRLLWNRLVLTAAHTLMDTETRTIPQLNDWQVRLERNRTSAGWAFTRGHAVVWHDLTLDLALIELPDGVDPVMRTRIAMVRGNIPHGVQAYGYPNASKSDGGPRQLEMAEGRLSGRVNERELTLALDGAYLPNNPPADWPGMSGGPVFLADWHDSEVVWVHGAVKLVPGQFSGQLRVASLAEAWEIQAFRDVVTSYDPAALPPDDPTGVPSAPRRGQLPLPEDRLPRAVRLFDRVDSSMKFLATVTRVQRGRAPPPGDAVICATRDAVPHHFQDRLKLELAERFAAEAERLRTEIVPIHWPRALPPEDALDEVLRELYEVLEPVMTDTERFGGFADAEMLREALVQPGAARWYWIDIADAGGCDEDLAAQIDRLRKMWTEATVGLKESDVRPPRNLACGMLFVLHEVTEIPDKLRPVFTGLEPIVLGVCSRDELLAWPRNLQERSRPNARGPGAPPPEAAEQTFRQLARWVTETAAHQDFNPMFPLRRLLRDVAPDDYPEY